MEPRGSDCAKHEDLPSVRGDRSGARQGNREASPTGEAAGAGERRGTTSRPKRPCLTITVPVVQSRP